MTGLFFDDGDVSYLVGDALDVLRGMPDGSVDAVVTSPPYLDARPEYPSPTIPEFAAIFNELRRVVTGPLVLNLGRVFRDGVEVRWHDRLLDAAEQQGWPVLDTLIWTKPNANPIHGTLFANSHEYAYILGRPGTRINEDAIRTVFAASTLPRLGRSWINHRGVKMPRESRARKTRAEPHPLGARPRSFVAFCVGKEKGNPHPAPMAPEFAEHLVKLAAWPGQTILDPFAGSGNTALAARKHGRRAVLIDVMPEYADIAARRLGQLSLLAGLSR